MSAMRQKSCWLGLLLLSLSAPAIAADSYSSDDRYITVEDFSRPVADALKAFTNNDLKFIALGGTTPQIPGVDLAATHQVGYRIMRGTEDAMRSGEKRPDRPKAALYAQAFNRELSMYIFLKKKGKH